MNIEKLKKSKKGFTLVEIIVVLVIIAILAAIAIPAMTGWIDKANEKTIMAEARTVLLAAQTLASESYGTGTATAPAIDVEDLAEVEGTVSGIVLSGAQVTDIVYTNGGYSATYDAGTWTVSED
jgi:type IV pilus assembly protein PilA